MTTLIFDCDGVLADTERHGHLPAYNRTFADFNVPVCWSPDDYADKLKIAGGKERMLSLFTPAFVASTGLPSDEAGQRALVARWHQHKTAIYTAMVAEGRTPARPGVARLVRAAQAAGWTTAVASTSAPDAVEAVLEAAVGPEAARRFAGVFAGDIVERKKPGPDIYLLAMDRLGADRRDTLVVEDSRNGLLAATGAGLACVVTVNGYTAHENFDEARLVVSDLGEPDAPMRVLANRSSGAPRGMIGLADLAACLTEVRDHPVIEPRRADVA